MVTSPAFTGTSLPSWSLKVLVPEAMMWVCSSVVCLWQPMESPGCSVSQLISSMAWPFVALSRVKAYSSTSVALPPPASFLSAWTRPSLG